MSHQWLNQCKCNHEKHNNMPRGKCITRNIVGEICEDCAKNCSGLTKLAHDAGDSADLKALSGASEESTSQKSDALTQRV